MISRNALALTLLVVLGTAVLFWQLRGSCPENRRRRRIADNCANATVSIQAKADFKPGVPHKRLRDNLAKMASSGRVLLGVGSSSLIAPGWVGSDIADLNVISWDNWQYVTPKDGFDVIFSEHMFEHLTPIETLLTATWMFKSLKPGGRVRVAVPDGLKPNKDFLYYIGLHFDREKDQNRQGHPHKMIWSYETLSEMFTVVGFRVELLEYWDGFDFHATNWDVAYGKVRRSTRFDERNQGADKTAYSSLIIDAIKE